MRGCGLPHPQAEQRRDGSNIEAVACVDESARCSRRQRVKKHSSFVGSSEDASSVDLKIAVEILHG